jgi:3,4-dihydroxy 2-butanone 4-phosphate synthase/GTP cyclohydrolase II
VLAWHSTAEQHNTELSTVAIAAQLDALQQWAQAQGLQVEREEHPRLLALLNQPALAVVLSGLDQTRGGVGAVGAALSQMAHWSHTSAVSLLLAPDAQRSSHPSADLEPQQRSLSELGAELKVQPGAFLVWR